MTVPVDAIVRDRDWTPLNGAFLVDAIDRLYREHVHRSIEAHTQHVAGWGSATDRKNLITRLGDKWWRTLGPAIELIPTHRLGVHDLPPGRDSTWVERHAVLKNGSVPLFLELCSGRILVDADGPFKPVTVPAELWRAANWVLYRASPLDPASSQLVAFNSAGEELPAYNNPRLIVPRPASAPRAKDITSGKRADPRVKRDEMLRGLEFALQQANIRPGMTLKELHLGMLNGLEIPQRSITRGFDYDAFRKHCRAWLIEHRFIR